MTGPSSEPSSEPLTPVPVDSWVKRRRWSMWAVSLIAVVLVVVAYQRLNAVEISSGPAGSAGAARDLVQQYAPAEREQVGEFRAGTLGGDEVTDADLRAGVAVVNVWGSWCGPCRVEAPVLAQLAADYGDRVVFLGLNVRDNADAARAFERSYAIPYDSVVPEESAELLLKFGSSLRTSAVPVTLIIDGEGRVAARVLGAVDETTMRGLLDDALAE